ncbi:hypothetical protein B0H19DRAFT_1257885 [Mycena capillaripes]|nr:hypothetical protein B0H19DRAFT_1257885 [Mycena capillaripes]
MPAQPSHSLSQTLTLQGAEKAQRPWTVSAPDVPLIDLNADVMGHIFALSDVYTILSLSRVNRLFHKISSTKQLWLSVVCNLFARQLIDTPLADIDKLSKDALVDEVKLVVDGPETWSPMFEPLPGNAYVLCYSVNPFRTVECLEIHSGRLAWEGLRPGFDVRTVAFDFLVEIFEAVVTLIVSTPMDNSLELVILQADLKTGHSEALFILLWNWRAEKFIVFDGTINPPPNVRVFSSFYPWDSFMLLPGPLYGGPDALPAPKTFGDIGVRALNKRP